MNDAPTWPAELDALLAAPDHHRLVFENDRVRVLETIIRPGETTAVHTHRWPAVLHMLKSAPFIRRADTGEVILDTRGVVPDATQAIRWIEPLPPHSLENVGDEAIHVIHIELKS